MIDDAIREARRKVVGCSDISSIIIDPGTGKPVSPWGTPYKIWRAKNFGEDIPETPQMRFGDIGEAFAAGEWMRDAEHQGWRLFNYNTMLRKGWLGGNIDRAVQRPGEPMPIQGGQLVAKLGLEIKTCGELTPWTEIPLHYQLQVQGYLYLADSADEWELTVLYRTTLKHDNFRAQRDPNFAASIVPLIEEWGDRYIGHFDPNDPPPAVCEADCKAEYLRRKPDMVSIPVTDALYDAISRIKAASARKKEAEAEIDSAREEVILAMANAKDENGRCAEAVTGYDGKTLCTYKATKPRAKVDYEAAMKTAIKNNLVGEGFLDDFTSTQEGAPRFLVK